MQPDQYRYRRVCDRQADMPCDRGRVVARDRHAPGCRPEKRALIAERNASVRLLGQQAVDMGLHLLKELLASKLARMGHDLRGIDMEIIQAPDRGRDRLRRL